MQQTNSVYPSIGQTFALVGIYLLAMVAGAIVIFLPLHIGLGFSESFCTMLCAAAASGAALWYAYRKKGDKPLNWRLSSKQAIICIAAVFIAFSSPILIEAFIMLIPFPESWAASLAEAFKADIWTFGMAVFFAPLVEEVLFRGIILKGYLQQFSPTKAIIISALFFGLIHFHPIQGLSAAMIGIVLGWMYWRTQSLIPGIITHFVNNLVAMLLVFSYGSVDISISEIVGGGMTYSILLVVALLVFSGSLYLIQKNTTVTMRSKSEQNIPLQDTIAVA